MSFYAALSLLYSVEREKCKIARFAGGTLITTESGEGAELYLSDHPDAESVQLTLEHYNQQREC